jgi:chromosome segregation protein
LRELEKLEERLKDLEQERNKILDEIVIQRHDIFNTRLSSVEEINEKLKGRLKISVKYEEDKKEFLDRLGTLLKGSRVSTDAIDAMCNNPKTIDGVLLAKYIKEGEERLVQEFDLTNTMATRIANWFLDGKSRLFELETLFPEDKIAIQLRVNDEYKNLEELSVGQKATALLLLLFAQENRILILDQPEEDLDNRFIYEDVVKILREMKGRRQIIIATHNANIPVLGDSELILVLESREEHCAIVDKGSIDKNSIRKHIKDIMEGGEEAFKRRAEKYGA